MFAIKTKGVTPAGVDVVVPIVSVTVIGTLEVGFTVFDGMKLQVAPVGNPLQERVTAPPKDPDPVTWNVIG